jgi:predicted Zn finger-like uncharacterized protein
LPRSGPYINAPTRSHVACGRGVVFGRAQTGQPVQRTMDVQCERCRIEYTFNDALVSVRGTPVRCTSCGHEFKVYRPSGSAAGASEQWLVRTVGGQELPFPSFRELQNAILAMRVSRDDVLVRDGVPAQPLGVISELEPLFDRQSAPASPAGLINADRFQSASLAPVLSSRAPGPTSPGYNEAPPSSRRGGGGAIAAVISQPARGKVDTLRPPPMGSAAPPPAPSSAPSMMDDESLPPAPASEPRTLTGVGAARIQWPPDGPVLDPAAEQDRVGPASLPPPPRPLWRERLPSDDELPEIRSLAPATEESYSTAPRRRVGGWVVGLALLGAVGVVGWAAAKPYLQSRDAGAAVQLNPRAQAFVSDGEKAMADGDLDVAQENFDKASALAEDDARVSLDEARVAAAKADVPWLKIRLLSPDAADDLRTTKAELDELADRARRAAVKARARATDDVSAVRVEIDALRLSGDRATARGFVPKVIVQASQPETAYVLAALDLAEPEPVWATVIERLRIAAAGEGDAGRARAALVYALARSGDGPAASAELTKIDTLVRPYPLLPNLHAFVGKTATQSEAPPAGVAVGASPSLPLAPLASTARRLTPPAAAPARSEAIAPDARTSMQWASNAIKKGDFGRAGQIYQALATRNPNDSEALSGLGDVARLTANPAGAMAAYRRAIAVNPSYLPALLGLADTEWTAGDRAAAIRAYGDIVDRFPEGTYAPYVSKRANGAAPSVAPPPAAAPSVNGTNAAPAPDEHAE